MELLLEVHQLLLVSPFSVATFATCVYVRVGLFHSIYNVFHTSPDEYNYDFR